MYCNYDYGVKHKQKDNVMGSLFMLTDTSYHKGSIRGSILNSMRGLSLHHCSLALSGP